jgi:methyl-accepting chemotaxis protein
MIASMDDEALLKRIDRRLDLTEEHIRQGTEHIRQGNEVMRESNACARESHEIMRESHEIMRECKECMREVRLATQENTRAISDLRTTLNQWNLRQEKMMREVLAASREMITGMREFRRDSIEEARAQRAALFAILDELKGRGPAAA